MFILLSEATVVYRLLTERFGPEVPINFNSLVSVKSTQYNMKTENIYWLDSTTNEIKYLSKRG